MHTQVLIHTLMHTHALDSHMLLYVFCFFFGGVVGHTIRPQRRLCSCFNTQQLITQMLMQLLRHTHRDAHMLWQSSWFSLQQNTALQRTSIE